MAQFALIFPTLLALSSPPLAIEERIGRGLIGDSRCSNPSQEGIRARAVTRVPRGEAAWRRDVEAFIAAAGLDGGAGEGWSGSNEPSYHTVTFILFSPRHTVVLLISFDSRRDTIRLRVERNCFDDSPLEDWRPYWLRLISHLRTRHYIVREISRSQRR